MGQVRRLLAAARLRFGPVIDRASPSDLAMLGMDAGPVPQQIGAVLVLDAGPAFDLSAAQGLLADRVRGVPRLRQRLVRVPQAAAGRSGSMPPTSISAATCGTWPVRSPATSGPC